LHSDPWNYSIVLKTLNDNEKCSARSARKQHAKPVAQRIDAAPFGGFMSRPVAVFAVILGILCAHSPTAASELENRVDIQFTCEEMKQLIAEFFPANDTAVMLCISYYASGYDPAVIAANGAVGLFQILPKHCGTPNCPPNNVNCEVVRCKVFMNYLYRCARSLGDPPLLS
jgi:hypothetical protein